MTDAPTAPHADASVRRARPADATAIADITLESWRAQPVDLLPSDALDAVDAADLAAQWGEAITAPPSALHVVLAATEGAEVVGYAVTAPSQDPDASSDVAELVDLVVRADRTRRGHGSRLLAAAVDTLREAGCTEVAAWVAAHDDARRELLSSAGFAADGAHRTLGEGPGTGSLRQVRWSARIS